MTLGIKYLEIVDEWKFWLTIEEMQKVFWYGVKAFTMANGIAYAGSEITRDLNNYFKVDRWWTEQ